MLLSVNWKILINLKVYRAASRLFAYLWRTTVWIYGIEFKRNSEHIAFQNSEQKQARNKRMEFLTRETIKLRSL